MAPIKKLNKQIESAVKCVQGNNCQLKVKVKSKVYPRTGLEDPRGS